MSKRFIGSAVIFALLMNWLMGVKPAQSSAQCINPFKEANKRLLAELKRHSAPKEYAYYESLFDEHAKAQAVECQQITAMSEPL